MTIFISQVKKTHTVYSLNFFIFDQMPILLKFRQVHSHYRFEHPNLFVFNMSISNLTWPKLPKNTFYFLCQNQSFVWIRTFGKNYILLIVLKKCGWCQNSFVSTVRNNEATLIRLKIIRLINNPHNFSNVCF